MTIIIIIIRRRRRRRMVIALSVAGAIMLVNIIFARVDLLNLSCPQTSTHLPAIPRLRVLAGWQYMSYSESNLL
jgi:hypothetical protein